MLVKTLQQTHPSYDEASLRRLRALYEGGPSWRAIAPVEWFPQRFAEPQDVYEERKKLLNYVNHAGSLVEMVGALLFAEAPQLEGVPSPPVPEPDGKGSRPATRAELYWSGLLKDCDRAGTPWRQFWRDRFLAAQVGRRAYVWVNLPVRAASAADISRADEDTLGLLDAHLVALDPEQVIDWGRDDHGRLAWVMIRSVISRRASIDEPRRREWRWTYIDGVTIRRWEWQPTETASEPPPEDTAQELAPIAHGAGRLPLVELALPEGLHTMGKLEDAAVAAARARNEHSWALHQAANELLTITAKWGDETAKPVLGHGYALRLSRDTDGQDAAAYVGPSGVAFQFLEKDVEATREDLFRVVQQMAMAADSDASRIRASGESKAQDWKAVDVMLGAYRDHVLQAMAETVALIADVRGEDLPDVVVSGLDGWQTEDLTTWLASVAMAPEAVRASPTLRREIAKRQAERLLQGDADDTVMATIRREIDEEPDEVDPLYRAPRSPRPPSAE